MTVRVLIIDDEPGDVALMRRFLARGPEAEIRDCSDTEDAVAVARQWKPHLVLLDLNMPQLGGHEVLFRIKQFEATENTVVVIISSSEDPNDIKLAYRQGSAAYIAKPESLQGYKAAAKAIWDFWIAQNRYVGGQE